MPRKPPRIVPETGLSRPARHLSRLPRWVILLATVALVLLGLFVKGPGGAAALLVVAALVGWLLAISWSLLPPAGRVSRLALLLAVVAVAGWQVTR